MFCLQNNILVKFTLVSLSSCTNLDFYGLTLKWSFFQKNFCQTDVYFLMFSLQINVIKQNWVLSKNDIVKCQFMKTSPISYFLFFIFSKSNL